VERISDIKFVENYVAAEMGQASKDTGKHEQEVQKKEILSNHPEK
jgi:hypothetical protein